MNKNINKELSFIVLIVIGIIVIFNFPSNECEYGDKSGKLFYVKKETVLKEKPFDISLKKINKKASSFFKDKTIYQNVDPSCLVKEMCRHNSWSKVQIIKPKWLSNTHIGWVKNEVLESIDKNKEPTRALESKLSLDNPKSVNTSENLSKADLSWHAIATYGWDCNEVLKKGGVKTIKDGDLYIESSAGQIKGEYYEIVCSSGLRLKVFPRKNAHPLITNIEGDFRTLD